MEIELKALDTDDHDQCHEFVHFVNQHYKGMAYPVTEETVKKNDYHFFWAFRGKDRVGTAGYRQQTPTLAETIKTIVDPKYRGEGLGKILSQKIEDKCQADGIKKVFTTIYSTNHSMIGIKLKQGYTIEGFHPDHEAPGFDEYSLGKVLS